MKQENDEEDDERKDTEEVNLPKKNVKISSQSRTNRSVRSSVLSSYIQFHLPGRSAGPKL